MEKLNTTKVRCLICTSVGQWKSVDQYRYKPSGMHICQSCGFVTYPDVLMKTKDLTEFYREEYREPPGYPNLVTGEKKLHYHSAFLEQLLKEWKDSGQEKTVCEVGAAFGMFLDWIRRVVPGTKVFGTELTTSMVRNAFHLYGLKLTDEIDMSVKYDMIASYKVAEHQPDFDLELAKYAKALKPDGRLYISVPTWMHAMTNFGVSGFSIEYYYHKNHINVWTRKAFEGLLRRCGFEIVQENHTFYDDTYLCKYVPGATAEPAKEDPADIEDRMQKILLATQAFDKGDYAAALGHWENFPDAHTAHYEMNRAKFHQNGFDWILENVGQRAVKACPKSAQTFLLCADICMRYSQWEKALEFFNKYLDWRPQDGQVLLQIANCFRQIAMLVQDAAERTRLIQEARNICKGVTIISQGNKPDALTWMMNDNARIPTPWERAPQPVR